MRRLDSEHSYPFSLVAEPRGSRVLDWQLAALQECRITDVVFVGGYHIEKLIEHYAKVDYRFNPRWAETGPLHSLFLVEEAAGPCLILHADVLFSADTLNQVLQLPGDLVAPVSARPGLGEGLKADGRLAATLDPKSGIQFSGIVKCGSRGWEVLAKSYADALEENARLGPMDVTVEIAGLPDLLHSMPGSELQVPLLSGSWAKVNRPDVLSRFAMGSKAQTLENLRRVVRFTTVLDQVRFTVGEWAANSEKIIARIAEKFGKRTLIARSSALTEDGWTTSNAGAFHSELNIDGAVPEAVARGIEKVVASLPVDDHLSQDHQVFVQPLIQDISVSGVAFTRDPETWGPYVVINYDMRSGRSDTVTSGIGDNLNTTYVHHDHLDAIAPELKPLVPALKELSALVGFDRLDVEFAIDGNRRCFLLQVRPITIQVNQDETFSESDLRAEIEVAKRFITAASGRNLWPLDEKAVLSNMSDWNPAEMIGERPKPLAASLYRKLITDWTWAESRRAMGYRDQSNAPLMILIAGRPYIDTWQSFNSFIPASLPDELSRKIASHYSDCLRRQPWMHDKVEFAIAFTCLDFAFDINSTRLGDAGFSSDEIALLKEGLRALTDDLVAGKRVPIRGELDQLDEMNRRRNRVMEVAPTDTSELGHRLTLLLADCRRHGTLPFSNLARHAFIASSLMESLVTRGVFQAADVEMMKSNLPTVAHDIARTMTDAVTGDEARSAFLDQYGHLRPGTYDILSPSYDESPDIYLSESHANGGLSVRDCDPRKFDELFLSRQAVINSLCHEQGFTFDARQLVTYIRDAIPAREKAKFEFTKNISQALKTISQIGEAQGLERDALSFLPVDRFQEVSTVSPKFATPHLWQREIETNRKYFDLVRAMHMPPVICDGSDITSFSVSAGWPNFITSGVVSAPVAVLSYEAPPESLDGCIVVVENADPGYDWIFSRNIAGLVTKYGGVASHMAIRCAEFGLPAAIGCGEIHYDKVINAGKLVIDCAQRTLTPID